MYKFKEWISDISIYRVITGGLMVLGALFMLLRLVYSYYPILGYCLGIYTLFYLGAELLGVFNKEIDWKTRIFIWISGYGVAPFLAFLYSVGIARNSLTLFYWLLCILLVIWFVVLMCIIDDRSHSKDKN